jgi:regulator of protease activity HflC (stomatin/prohibitin superfamily)
MVGKTEDNNDDENYESLASRIERIKMNSKYLSNREKVREFKAERMLTRDNVPVTIDAILRYKVIEDRAKDAILNVENFNDMIQQVSQTTLRNNIGGIPGNTLETS